MVSYVKTGVHVETGLGTTGGAVANLPNSGVSVLTARETYTLAPPARGVRKTLICASTSTAATTIVRGSTGTGVLFYTGAARTATQITFALATTGAQTVDLYGLSSVAWVQGPASVVGASAAGITVGTS